MGTGGGSGCARQAGTAQGQLCLETPPIRTTPGQLWNSLWPEVAPGSSHVFSWYSLSWIWARCLPRWGHLWAASLLVTAAPSCFQWLGNGREGVWRQKVPAAVWGSDADERSFIQRTFEWEQKKPEKGNVRQKKRSGEMKENRRQDSVVPLFALEVLKWWWSANAGKDEKESFILEDFTHPNFYHNTSHSKCFQEGIPLLGAF